MIGEKHTLAVIIAIYFTTFVACIVTMRNRKTDSHQTLTLVLIVLMVVVILAVAYLPSCDHEQVPSLKSFTLSQYQQQRQNKSSGDKLDIPLMDFPFAGSHDSATGMHSGEYGTMSSDVPMVRTQSLNIDEQYSAAGIRLFDLRVTWSWSIFGGRVLHFAHGPVPLGAVESHPAFEQMCNNAINDGEVVVLLFTHFNKGAQQETLDYLTKMFKGMSLSQYVHVLDSAHDGMVAMRELMDTKKYLVVSMNYKMNYVPTLTCFSGNGGCSASCLSGANSRPTEALKSYVLKTLTENKIERGYPSKVVQTMFQAASGMHELLLSAECLGLTEQSVTTTKKSKINEIVIHQWLGSTDIERVISSIGSTLLFDNVDSSTLSFKKMTDVYFGI